MRHYIKKIFLSLFPILRFIAANRKINKRIKDIDEERYENNLLYVDDYEKYGYDEILPFYQKTLETKKTLEDKAKISAVGITISTSIIVGLSGLLLNLNIDMKQLDASGIMLIILCVIVIIHINISGILALLVIGNKNKVYQLFPEDSQIEKQEQAKYLSIYTEQNANLNIIRQNFVYSSFVHLIYSVVLLSMIFILVTFNFNAKQNRSTDILILSDYLNSFKTDNIKQFNGIEDAIDKLEAGIGSIRSNYEHSDEAISSLQMELRRNQETINAIAKKVSVMAHDLETIKKINTGKNMHNKANSADAKKRAAD
jgi:hypothetical protein